MNVIFIHGPVASGKYTVAKALSQLTELPLFHNHLCVDLVTTLFEFGSRPFIQLREDIWLRSFEEAARAGRSFIFTFHPEATVTPEFITRSQQAVEKHGGQIYFIELICPEEVIEARIENPGRAKFGKLNSAAFYRQLKAEGAFNYPALPPPTLSIPTHTHSPQEAARLIKEHLEGVL